MPARLVALDEGTDIPLERAMLMVGRHPQCDARLDSIRVSRRHCCIMPEQSGEVLVRDLGSTNGIRINGQRVEMGKLKPGDELSIAHIRYRLVVGQGHDVTLAETMRHSRDERPPNGLSAEVLAPVPPLPDENPLAVAVRELLPSALADRCRIQVIVQVPPEEQAPAPAPDSDSNKSCPPDSSP